MIDPKDYPFHVQELGGEERFNEYIRLWKQSAPLRSDDEFIKKILDGEEMAEVSVSMWCNPWMR